MEKEHNKQPGSEGSEREKNYPKALPPKNSRAYNKKWKFLFDELYRASDALYQEIDESSDEDQCSNVLYYLEQNRRDFLQLIDKFQNQREYEQNPNYYRSVSWTVRKPSSTQEYSPNPYGSTYYAAQKGIMGGGGYVPYQSNVVGGAVPMQYPNPSWLYPEQQPLPFHPSQFNDSSTKNVYGYYNVMPPTVPQPPHVPVRFPVTTGPTNINEKKTLENNTGTTGQSTVGGTKEVIQNNEKGSEEETMSTRIRDTLSSDSDSSDINKPSVAVVEGGTKTKTTTAITTTTSADMNKHGGKAKGVVGGHEEVERKPTKGVVEGPVVSTTPGQSEASTNPQRAIPQSEASTNPQRAIPQSEASTNPQQAIPQSEASTNPQRAIPQSEASTNPQRAIPQSEASTNPQRAIPVCERRSHGLDTNPTSGITGHATSTIPTTSSVPTTSSTATWASIIITPTNPSSVVAPTSSSTHPSGIMAGKGSSHSSTNISGSGHNSRTGSFSSTSAGHHLHQPSATHTSTISNNNGGLSGIRLSSASPRATAKTTNTTTNNLDQHAKDELLSLLESERREEYDRVWKEAEEWLDAQVKAEDEAWDMLALALETTDVPPPPGLGVSSSSTLAPTIDGASYLNNGYLYNNTNIISHIAGAGAEAGGSSTTISPSSSVSTISGGFLGQAQTQTPALVSPMVNHLPPIGNLQDNGDNSGSCSMMASDTTGAQDSGMDKTREVKGRFQHSHPHRSRNSGSIPVPLIIFTDSDGDSLAPAKHTAVGGIAAHSNHHRYGISSPGGPSSSSFDSIDDVPQQSQFLIPKQSSSSCISPPSSPFSPTSLSRSSSVSGAGSGSGGSLPHPVLHSPTSSTSPSSSLGGQHHKSNSGGMMFDIDMTASGHIVTPTNNISHRFPSSTSSKQRSLHEKLSSPERRKAPLSPENARLRQEWKQLQAEINRDRSVNERVQKAMVTSSRVKATEEKNALKQQQANLSIEQRMQEAEMRRDAHINSIKYKASNENIKVLEVAFINSMNEEQLKHALQQKLQDAEKRITEVSERRRQHIDSIVGKQQKMGSKIQSQLRSLKMKHEEANLERWDKLQARLAVVQERRDRRLNEIQKRKLSGIGLDEGDIEVVVSGTDHVDKPDVLVQSSTTQYASNDLTKGTKGPVPVVKGNSKKKKDAKKKKKGGLVVVDGGVAAAGGEDMTHNDSATSGAMEASSALPLTSTKSTKEPSISIKNADVMCTSVPAKAAVTEVCQVTDTEAIYMRWLISNYPKLGLEGYNHPTTGQLSDGLRWSIVPDSAVSTSKHTVIYNAILGINRDIESIKYDHVQSIITFCKQGNTSAFKHIQPASGDDGAMITAKLAENVNSNDVSTNTDAVLDTKPVSTDVSGWTGMVSDLLKTLVKEINRHKERVNGTIQTPLSGTDVGIAEKNENKDEGSTKKKKKKKGSGCIGSSVKASTEEPDDYCVIPLNGNSTNSAVPVPSATAINRLTMLKAICAQYIDIVVNRLHLKSDKVPFNEHRCTIFFNMSILLNLVLQLVFNSHHYGVLHGCSHLPSLFHCIYYGGDIPAHAVSDVSVIRQQLLSLVCECYSVLMSTQTRIRSVSNGVLAGQTGIKTPYITQSLQLLDMLFIYGPLARTLVDLTHLLLLNMSQWHELYHSPEGVTANQLPPAVLLKTSNNINKNQMSDKMVAIYDISGNALSKTIDSSGIPPAASIQPESQPVSRNKQLSSSWPPHLYAYVTLQLLQTSSRISSFIVTSGGFEEARQREPGSGDGKEEEQLLSVHMLVAKIVGLQQPKRHHPSKENTNISDTASFDPSGSASDNRKSVLVDTTDTTVRMPMPMDANGAPIGDNTAAAVDLSCLAAVVSKCILSLQSQIHLCCVDAGSFEYANPMPTKASGKPATQPPSTTASSSTILKKKKEHRATTMNTGDGSGSGMSAKDPPSSTEYNRYVISRMLLSQLMFVDEGVGKLVGLVQMDVRWWRCRVGVTGERPLQGVRRWWKGADTAVEVMADIRTSGTPEVLLTCYSGDDVQGDEASPLLSEQERQYINRMVYLGTSSRLLPAMITPSSSTLATPGGSDIIPNLVTLLSCMVLQQQKPPSSLPPYSVTSPPPTSSGTSPYDSFTQQSAYTHNQPLVEYYHRPLHSSSTTILPVSSPLLLLGGSKSTGSGGISSGGYYRGGTSGLSTPFRGGGSNATPTGSYETSSVPYLSSVSSSSPNSTPFSGNNNSHAPLLFDTEAPGSHCLHPVLLYYSYRILVTINTLVSSIDLSLIQCIPIDVQLILGHTVEKLLNIFSKIIESPGEYKSECLQMSGGHSNKGGHGAVPVLFGDLAEERGAIVPPDTSQFEVADEALHQLMRLISSLCLDCPSLTQSMFSSSKGSILLKLCQLPVKYISNDDYKYQLMPTLITMCMCCPSNYCLYKREMSPRLAVDFVQEAQGVYEAYKEEQQQQEESEKRGGSKQDGSITRQYEEIHDSSSQLPISEPLDGGKGVGTAEESWLECLTHMESGTIGDLDSSVDSEKLPTGPGAGSGMYAVVGEQEKADQRQRMIDFSHRIPVCKWDEVIKSFST